MKKCNDSGVLAALAFAVGVFVGVRSIPDAKRYVEMRRM